MTNKTTFKIILVILFLAVYAALSTSLLHTESFVLFISFSLVLLVVLGNKDLQAKVSKEEFKFEETVRFLVLLKNWNRALIRLVDIKMYHFLVLVVELSKYQINWLNNNMSKVQHSQYLSLKKSVSKRLSVLSARKKANVFSYETIKYLPLSTDFVDTDLPVSDYEKLIANADIDTASVEDNYEELLSESVEDFQDDFADESEESTEEMEESNTTSESEFEINK